MATYNEHQQRELDIKSGRELDKREASVYLCHKCKGLLTACDEPAFYACGCISGYVRDFQTPVPVSSVRLTQIHELEDRLRLYAGQGRKESDGSVVLAKAELARLILDQKEVSMFELLQNLAELLTEVDELFQDDERHMAFGKLRDARNLVDELLDKTAGGAT